MIREIPMMVVRSTLAVAIIAPDEMRSTAAGLPVIEVSAFVSPKWVPAMADASEVFAGITRRPGTRYAALVPNLAGLERAHALRLFLLGRRSLDACRGFWWLRALVVIAHWFPSVQLNLWQIVAGYVAAVAVEGGAMTIVPRRWRNRPL